MYDALARFLDRPAPFSISTTEALWTDPHVARQMLRFHLDGDNDLASRRTATIDAFALWLDQRFGFDGKCVTDLGCGPGLYTLRYATRGARVTGVDFSENSLAHARGAAADAGLMIDYRRADYLKAELPADQDVVTMIYGDFCTIGPDRRRLLLDKVRRTLTAGGAFVFDVFSTGMFAELTEETVIERRLQGGFWADGDYVGLKSTVLYPDEAIGLDRYLIATPERRFEIFNWMQYYTPQTITEEVLAAGYSSVEIADFVTGEPWTDSATAFAVIARP